MPQLLVKFNSRIAFNKAEYFFNTASDFTHQEANQEFLSLGFLVADEADADQLEHYLTEEIQGKTALTGYSFEFED
jgi:hypothetical protein